MPPGAAMAPLPDELKVELPGVPREVIEIASTLQVVGIQPTPDGRGIVLQCVFVLPADLVEVPRLLVATSLREGPGGQLNAQGAKQQHPLLKALAAPILAVVRLFSDQLNATAIARMKAAAEQSQPVR